ncbi:MAG: type III-A CRISPR-associated RAMP protein Csm4 [candidate division KSB1 bacterium]|nr:type III-A CRISPR-associated RAMP protein Csm4 [candidate division KSB1 bacterium]
MPTAIIYRLSFRAPLHIGERGVALEETRVHVPADTLFSALCTSWRVLFGAEALERELLDWFSGTEEEHPFHLTSAFPFAGEVLLFPKPVGRLRNLLLSSGDEKALKRVRFVSQEVLAALARGKQLQFSPKSCINGGVAWVSEREMEKLAALVEPAGDQAVLWRTATVPRVTLDRISNASAIWHFGEVHYARGGGLWFAAIFNPAHGDQLRQRFDAALALLGDSGLGGERGAGRGLFTFTKNEGDLPGVEDAPYFVTLAPFCPKDASQLAALTADRSAYELIARRGWVTSPEGSNLRRKTVWMFAEGSTFSAATTLPGCLVDVTPEPCPHKVWRYGYAFPLGVNMP